MENNEWTTKLEAYEAAREELRQLIDNPDKTITPAEYRAKIKAAQSASNKAHKAWLAVDA